MPIATLDEVKDALGITTTDNDTQITALLDPFTALIESEAGRAFSSARVTERHRGGEPTIALRRFPVDDGSPQLAVTDKATDEALDSDDYQLEPETGLLRRLPLGSTWAKSRAAQMVYLREAPPVMRWEVVYTGGPVTAPGDIKLALYLALGAAVQGGGGMAGMQSEKDGDYSYVRAAGGTETGLALPAQAAAIARSYRAGMFI